MTENKADAKLDEAKGRAKKATGEATDNQDLKDEGSVDKAAGEAKEKTGEAADKAKGLVDKARDALRRDKD